MFVAVNATPAVSCRKVTLRGTLGEWLHAHAKLAVISPFCWRLLPRSCYQQIVLLLIARVARERCTHGNMQRLPG